MDPPEKVKNREVNVLQKQDCVVGDSDGVVKWEGDVGKLKEGGCYRLVKVGVRCFCGANLGKGTEVVEVGSIGETAEVEDGDLELCGKW